MKKRWISLFLALTMLLSVLPLPIIANEEIEIEENPWSGRSAVFVGDSITAGVNTTKLYYQFLDEKLGFDSVTAMGVGGSCISAASDYGQKNQPLINRYQNIPSADLIVIFMGTNDYGHETPLGSEDDTKDGTFYGALNTIIPELLTKHTTSKIVFVTPMHRYGLGTSKILGTKYTYDHIPNGVGASLGDYVDALKYVCAKNEVSVIDLYTECTLDPSDPDTRSMYMPDGLHPNANGHEVIAGIMESHIWSYEPVDKKPTEQPEMVYGNKFAAGYNKTCRVSSRVNYYLKAGTIITLKDPTAMQWACAVTPDEYSSKNLGYFPDKQWTDKETAVVEEDSWVGFTFKYRDETRSFDLTKPLSDYIAIEAPTPPALSGKTLSILGASISTFAGTSNGAAAETTNSTIKKNAIYYPNSTIPEVTLHDTWWKQVEQDLGLRLLVNNAWSGSAILLKRSGTVGAYVDRCVQLHDNTGENAGEEPDIICIQMGFNDFSYGKETLGTSDIDYETLITAEGYGTPTTTMEATAIMLDKMTKRYPNAEIYMFNHFKRIGQSASDTVLMEQLNESIGDVCSRFHVKVVDLYSVLNESRFIGDGRLHPNRLGMDVISEAVKNTIIENTDYSVNAHTVSFDLDDVTADYGADKIVLDGSPFICNLTAASGYTPSVTVTMGGKDITADSYADGVISIEAVTEDVVITAKAAISEHEPQTYRWEFDGTDLVSAASAENHLTKDAGTTTDGVFNKTRYHLDTAVYLLHGQSWSVEWKSSGTWRNSSSSSGGRLFTTTPLNADYNARYIFKSANSYLIAMGEKDTAGSHNYGIALADHGIDGSAEHTYRLTNRIADDGSNMIYLYVDGVEIGAMNHYYIGTNSQNTTSDWLAGKDFIFPYIGTDTHGLTNCSIEYLQVWEGGHSHSYTSEITTPTCTEQGYTTYTCACGDSYVSDYTDPRPLNILMIGNSFSWDAADFWYDMQTSMTYDAMKSMMADPYDVHLAVMYKGSATLAYHATCAMKNTSAYTYTEIGPETNYQWTPSGGTNATNNILDQLEARDWDIIVIQSYQHEADGTEPRSTYTGGDARFTEPEDSIGYLLDYFAEHEPNADVYYYMPWATTKFYGSDTETGYHAMAKYTETTVPNLTGTNSGKSFAGIIPVGTGIQNARTTYFDALRFSSGTGSTALLKDPQNGLQYDSQHLSFGLGRYIAGIIVAETLIPQGMRKDSYVLPNVKESPAVGELPQEYSVIGQLAAKYALQDPFKLTTLADYDTELADRVCEVIKTADYSTDGISGESDLQTYVESVVAEKLENMGAAEHSVTFHSFTLENGQIVDMEATVALRVGYTSRSVEIMVTNGMAHPFGEWEIVSVPSATAPGLNRRFCEICGLVEEVEVDGSWQKFALAEHLQMLPDDFCSETNLWDFLEPEKLMINHLGEWVSAGSTVYSVTIPVKSGDKIYANSFDQTDERKGIQVSFIGDYGIVKTTFSSQTYKEFQANGGYLIAPEGAIAVNIPVWNVNADNNTINFLGYDHVYSSAVTAPTCTEKGYTTYTCECGDSYVGDYVEATGEHTFSDGLCTLCGAKDPSVQQGDVNFDGIIDASDVNYIYRSVMGYVTLTEAQNIFANFNDDNIVDSADVNLLYRYVMGYIKPAQSQ